MRLPLRSRLLLPLTLLLVGDAAATWWAADHAARTAEHRLAEQQAAVARTLIGSGPTFPINEPVLTSMKGLSGADFLFIHPGQSNLYTRPGPVPDAPAGVPALGGEGANRQLGPPVILEGIEYRALRLPFPERHPAQGGSLFILYPESERVTAVRDAMRPTLALGLVGGLAAVALTLVIGTGLVRRIRNLDRHTRVIAAGDFRPIPLPHANDELTDLHRSVNDMARRLTEFQEALQRNERLRVLGQFSGGLAHQLRNAASGAKLALEVFLAENTIADTEPLQIALRQLARIEVNLRQFLDLGKPPSSANVSCDLVKLLDQSVSLLRPQCQHAGTSLSWEHDQVGSISITGDPAQLSHLFGNVIGNAVEAAGPGGSVRVAINRSSDGPCVNVSDSGNGPPQEIASRLFEPFVTGKDEGIGLGLAVAKQAADTHHAVLSWTREGGWTVFRIQFSADRP